MTNFNSKETYLAATAEWKATYKQITYDSQLARRRFNEAASIFSRTGPYLYGKGPAANADYNAAYMVMHEARNARDLLRNEANGALAERQAMKAEAARQWEQARALA